MEYRWSTQDQMPVDGMPYVGRLTPLSDRLLVATGYRKWGMTNGTAAALVLSDQILGRDNPWSATLSATRVKPLASARELVLENANVGKRFFLDRLKGGSRSPDDLSPGEGGVVTAAGERVAAYRDQAGGLHGVSPTCTHLWCQVVWNSAERSWDCPCHGSRFDPDGRVLQGPAVDDLPPTPLN